MEFLYTLALILVCASVIAAAIVTVIEVVRFLGRDIEYDD
jgi:hypothetical protein